MILNITAIELQKRLENKDSLVILDCRDREDFDKESIEGSLRVPVESLEETWQEHFSEDDHIAVICNTGRRSIKACQILNDEGLQHIFCLQGGLRLWKESGLPTKK